MAVPDWQPIILTNLHLKEHSQWDTCFHIICIPENTVSNWRTCVQKHLVKLDSETIIVMVGSNMIPWPEKLSVKNQW